MIQIKVQIGPAIELLQRVRAAAADLRKVWAEAARPLVSRFFTRQFATAGAEGGTPWAPLSPATIAFKARFGRAEMGPLRFENHLWASLVNAPAPMGIEEIAPDRYVRGTADPKAALHQTGFLVKGWGRVVFNPPRAVPARPIVPPAGLPPAYVAELEQAVARHLEDEGERGK